MLDFPVSLLSVFEPKVQTVCCLKELFVCGLFFSSRVAPSAVCLIFMDNVSTGSPQNEFLPDTPLSEILLKEECYREPLLCGRQFKIIREDDYQVPIG